MSNTQDRDFAQVLKESFDGTSSSLKTLSVNALIPTQYDDIQLAYTGTDLTQVTYKKNGVTVAVLNLTYSGGNLIEIARS